MQHIGTHLHRSVLKARATERGELMRFFLSKINPPRKHDGYAPVSMAHLGKILEKIPTKDLYYLKRVCSDASNFSKRFWWELDPEKHTPESLARQRREFERAGKGRKRV